MSRHLLFVLLLPTAVAMANDRPAAQHTAGSAKGQTKTEAAQARTEHEQGQTEKTQRLPLDVQAKPKAAPGQTEHAQAQKAQEQTQEAQRQAEEAQSKTDEGAKLLCVAFHCAGDIPKAQRARKDARHASGPCRVLQHRTDSMA